MRACQLPGATVGGLIPGGGGAGGGVTPTGMNCTAALLGYLLSAPVAESIAHPMPPPRMMLPNVPAP